MENSLFNTWLSRWGLTPDGQPLETHTSQLLPVVTKDGQKAILKLTDDDSERNGCELMVWWNGNGAAKVLAHAAGAILLERATGAGSLADMSGLAMMRRPVALFAMQPVDSISPECVNACVNTAALLVSLSGSCREKAWRHPDALCRGGKRIALLSPE